MLCACCTPSFRITLKYDLALRKSVPKQGSWIMFDLDQHDLGGHHWKGLHRMRSSASSFEPIGTHPGVGPKITKALLVLGLVEVGGNSQHPGQACYRVSALGLKVLARGPYAKRYAARPPAQPPSHQLP